MWYKTKAARLLGIDYPILQGPFGGNLSSVELVTTVSDAGGLGGYGAYTLSPQEIIEIDRQISPVLTHTKAKELMEAIVAETTDCYTSITAGSSGVTPFNN